MKKWIILDFNYTQDFYGLNSTADLLIKVKDVQDKPPFFQGLPYLKYIDENSTQAAIVRRIFVQFVMFR